MHWFNNFRGKFINIYTDSGGTKEETELLIEDLNGWKIPFISKEEKDITPKDILSGRLIFIHTPLSHNEVLYKNQNFCRYLDGSSLKNIK